MLDILPRKEGLFLFFCLMMAGYNASSQTADSLILEFNASTVPNERAILAYEIALATIGTNPSLATSYLRTAVKDTSGIEQRRLANCYKGLSVTLYYTGLYDSAVWFANKALFHYTELNNEVETLKMLKNRALSLSGLGRYTEALEDLLEALRFEKNIRDTSRLIGTLNDIGNTYIKIRNYDAGMKFQREALAYFKHYSNPAVEGNVLNSIGYIFDTGKIDADSAIFYYEKSLAIKEKHGNMYSVINTKNNLCSCYDLDTKLKAFMDCFSELLILQKEVNDVTGLVRSNTYLATAHRKLRNFSVALRYQQKAKEHAEQVKDPTLLADVYQRLAAIHKDQGNHRAALAAFEEHLAFKDSAYYLEQNRLTVEMAAKYELEKKNREIAETNTKLATTENERLINLDRVRSRNAWIGGLTMVLLLGTALGIVFTQRLRHRKEAEKSAAVLSERDRGLKAIIDAQEEERTRIARDLHDGVGNNLVALRMQLQNLSTGENAPLNDLIQRLSVIMDEVRGVSHEMMPKVLQEFGCEPAIRDMLERSLGGSPIRYSFETHNTAKRYPQRIETALYRISQELINNIVKHSGADQVTVQLLETDATLVLFVEDNGKGLNSIKSTDGIGMTNIKTRLNAINGELNISDGQVGGTVASIRIPLS